MVMPAAGAGADTSLKFTIDLVGWRDRRGRFARLSEDIQAAQTVALREALDAALLIAKAETPLGARPFGDGEEGGREPHMREMWRVRLAPAEGHGELVNESPHATFVFEPTAPHAIEARNAQVLRFMGRDGEPVFRRSVWHPGTKGNDILSTTERLMQAEMQAALSRSAASVVRAIEQVFT